MYQLYFGTRGYERWVKLPRPGVDRGLHGWATAASHVGGGATTQVSAGGHMEYGFQWNALSTSEMRAIRDILNGAYNTPENKGLIYFVDPAANRLNLFNEMWSRPALCAELGTPSITKGARPVLSNTGANDFRLPPRSAVFTVTEDTVPNTFYTPIPPGYTAHAAFYGPTAQALKVAAQVYNGETPGATSALGVIDNDNYGTGFSSFAAGAGVTGVEFSLAGSCTLTAALLQIIPTGETPVAPVEWASGGGHSGCRRPDDPEQNLLTVAFDQQTLGVRLVEQGSWQ